ncbi:hypothetical protein FXO38_32931 [Capsicum annuum]|nr:hypothetical protein FXO38_32931 [Capsicum annuum]
MTLEVKDSSSSGILICADGTFLNFTPREFAIITGLNCVSNRYDFIFYEGVPNRMVEKYFNGAKIIQKRQLFLAFTERVWGENNDADTEKFTILYFLHSFVLSNVKTVAIPRLRFDLVDSGRYKDFSWCSLSFEELARSLNNLLKASGQFYLIQGMPLTIQVWLYECCLNFPSKIASKVVFKNIEPMKNELSKLQIPQKDAIQHERSVDSNDDFQDPPPRKINEHSKKKRKVDSSTPVAKKPLRKKQVDIFDEHTQTRTPAPRAAKVDGMKTPVFKPIPTRQASSSKMKKGKQTARVIFPQVHSKPNIHVEKVVVSKPDSHVEKETFISKKDFDAFRDEEQVVVIEVDKPNVDEGGLEQSGQYFSPDVAQSLDNISDGTKQQHADKDPDLQNIDYVGTKRSPQRLSLEVDQELEATLLGKKTSDKKIDEIILSDSQFTIRDEMKGKVDHYKRGKSEIPKMHFGVETVEDKNWFYMMGFADQTWTDSHIDVCLYYLRKKLKYGPYSSYKNERNKLYKYSTVDCNFMNIIRSLNDAYSIDHQNLKDGGQEHHLIEYINGFCIHAAVSWHTVEDIYISVNTKDKHHWVLVVLSFLERCIFLFDSYESSGHYAVVLAEIEKIAKIISLCLQAFDFYVKKGIDLQNHPRYKDKESSNMFDVLFEDDLPQQPSGSLDCGVFMVMYAEYLSYGHKVIATEFDPNALRTRYAALLWDYGIRK